MTRVAVAARRPPMTIRLRLTIYWAAVLAVILLVAAIAVVTLFERQQWSGLDAALLKEAENTADQIQRSATPGALEILHRLASRRISAPAGAYESSRRIGSLETTATSTRSRRRSIRHSPPTRRLSATARSGSRSFR